jgi:hypothetical protein
MSRLPADGRLLVRFQHHLRFEGGAMLAASLLHGVVQKCTDRLLSLFTLPPQWRVAHRPQAPYTGISANGIQPQFQCNERSPIFADITGDDTMVRCPLTVNHTA